MKKQLLPNLSPLTLYFP